MGAQTAISWCHHTFNGWLGCVEAGPECDNCYARTQTPVRVHRSRGLELWGRTAARHKTSTTTWRAPLKWNAAAHAAGERRRVFAFSLADVLERHGLPETATQLDAWRADLWKLIDQTPWLDWLLLTKRPEGFRSLVPASWHAGAWPRNVWAGTTCGTRAGLARIRTLLECAGPAPVRFVSFEPLLEDLGEIDLRGIDWAIPGFESGRSARPGDIAWIRSLLRQCRAAGVAPFVKQLGARPFIGPSDSRMCTCVGGCGGRASLGVGWGCALDGGRLNIRDRAGADPAEWPEDIRVQEFPR